jgi:hypothetical protein
MFPPMRVFHAHEKVPDVDFREDKQRVSLFLASSGRVSSSNSFSQILGKLKCLVNLEKVPHLRTQRLVSTLERGSFLLGTFRFLLIFACFRQ